MKDLKLQVGFFSDIKNEKWVLTLSIFTFLTLAMAWQCMRQLGEGVALSSVSIVAWPLSSGLAAILLVGPVSLSYSVSRVITRPFKFPFLAISGIVFGSLLYLLSPVITILIERLFRLFEHNTFSGLGSYYASNWPLIFPGMAGYFLLVLLLLTMHLRAQARKSLERAEGLQRELRERNLTSLQYQLRPHFLFNSLNNIVMMVRKRESEASVEALVSLGAILSRVMGKNDQRMISLQEEVDLLDQFITIERLGDDQVELTTTIESSTKGVKVPVLILQPIVENAFKFSREADLPNPSVKISAEVVNGRLKLRVFNTGHVLKGWSLTDSTGIGLVNTIHRLRYIYGSGFSFTTRETTSGVEVMIDIPASPV